jgi:iron(III) transport system ATP-binding protein
MPEGAALELHGLRHAYGTTPVLDGVDVSVAEGELVALLGPSGCGKTTILRSIAGLLVPDAGEIRVGGAVAVAAGTEHLPAERRRVGLVFQDYALFPHMSVRANIGFGARGGGAAAHIERLLALTQLEEHAEKRPAALSGGQQQRVALARALAAEPAVVLLDEPFANVDAALRAELGAELRRLIAASRVPALLVTHDRDDALGLADRVAVLESGPQGARVVQAAPPHALYDHPATAGVARLSGPCTLVPAQATDGRAQSPLGPVALRTPHTGEVRLVVRPHQAHFEPGAGPSRVTRRRFSGPGWRIQVDGPTGALAVAWPAPEPPALGTSGTLTLRGPLSAVPGSTSDGR